MGWVGVGGIQSARLLSAFNHANGVVLEMVMLAGPQFGPD